MKIIRLIQTIIISTSLFFAIGVLLNSIFFSDSSLIVPAKASITAPNNFTEQSSSKINYNEPSSSLKEIIVPTSNDETSLPETPLIIEIKGKIIKDASFDYSMRQNNVPGEIRSQIISALQSHVDFRRLDPKDYYTIHLNKKNELLDCFFYAGPLESYSIISIDGVIKVTKDSINLESKTVKISGEIKNSLFLAFANINEGAKLVYAFADIFSSKIDFNTETQPGDKFTVLVKKYYKNNTFVGYGRITAAEYLKSNGQQLEGYYFTTGTDFGAYFDKEGEEVGTSFIRSPVPMARVTSKFTYRRKHPITGRIQPHLGIDLAAPLGTPILAAGDGKIKFIGRNRGNGRQIILSHSGGYQTYYGHLARYKKGLKKGSIVNKKDIIGYVGSSGLSTGPHLDYRIKHNGKFKNPFSVEFKPKSELSGEHLATFKNYTIEIRDYMNSSIEFPQAVLQVKNITITPEKKLILL